MAGLSTTGPPNSRPFLTTASANSGIPAHAKPPERALNWPMTSGEIFHTSILAIMDKLHQKKGIAFSADLSKERL